MIPDSAEPLPPLYDPFEAPSVETGVGDWTHVDAAFEPVDLPDDGGERVLPVLDLPLDFTTPADAHAALRDLFGFDGFRPGQQKVVDALIAGRDTLAVMPTGAGKSLCYKLPAILEEGSVTLVVSPLIALMDDQVRGLRLAGVPAAAMHSGQDRALNGAALRAAVSGEIRLLYASPERLLLDGILDILHKASVRRIVVDEAHCVSQWGFGFRPEYLGLSRLREVFPDVSVCAFTATADRATRDEIVSHLLRPDATVFVFGFDRPNIDLRIQEKVSPRKQLMAFLQDRRGESGIVYCLSRKAVDETAAALLRDGFNAIPYHAGMDQVVRNANQDRFSTESGVVMVATIAFGMESTNRTCVSCFTRMCRGLWRPTTRRSVGRAETGHPLSRTCCTGLRISERGVGSLRTEPPVRPKNDGSITGVSMRSSASARRRNAAAAAF